MNLLGFAAIGALITVILWLALREPGRDRDYQ